MKVNVSTEAEILSQATEFLTAQAAAALASRGPEAIRKRGREGKLGIVYAINLDGRYTLLICLGAVRKIWKIDEVKLSEMRSRPCLIRGHEGDMAVLHTSKITPPRHYAVVIAYHPDLNNPDLNKLER
ncbi:MAG: hypothetical protein OXG98_18955 [Gemmatimonadetes bacterium]|nr:hypothetical protein [Gemmatimonadota bacterium]